MAAPLKADYAFDTEDLDSSAKIVKFVILKKHQEQDARLSYKEIAAIAQIPPGTAMSRLAPRPRFKLRECLAARIGKDK
jgi:hypothetical protein